MTDKVLQDLINLKYDDIAKIGKISFAEEYFESVTLNNTHLIFALNEYCQGNISAGKIEEWANLIESNEAIKFSESHENEIKEVIFELANPIINGELTIERAKYLIEFLSKY